MKPNKTQLRQIVQAEFNKFVNTNFSVGQVISTRELKQKLHDKKPKNLRKKYAEYVALCGHTTAYGIKWDLTMFERTSRLMKKHPGYVSLNSYNKTGWRGNSIKCNNHGIYISK